MSVTRKRYFINLCIRIVVFIICLLMCLNPQNYTILEGMNFFKEFHILHLFWLIWMYDMTCQIIPIKNKKALGSQKLFANRYKPSTENLNKKTYTSFVKDSNKRALFVFIMWTMLLITLGTLYHFNIINKICLFMVTASFSVFDLICVLIWCPFRIIMKSKCCTTCRIFNWDHFFMFSPLIFINSFYTDSLVIMAILVLIVWEVTLIIHPERFREQTNITLRCSNCTDKLCTQYCQKKSKKR